MNKRRAEIVYHGTNVVNARKILREGFKEGTYFAIHMEDALGYGGAYLFEVVCPTHLIPKGCWQFRAAIIPEFIVRLTKYNPAKIMVDNMVLRHMVEISNKTKAQAEYTKRDMEVNPGRYTKAELTAYGVVKDE